MSPVGPGSRNSITDVTGLSLGHAVDTDILTGVTVIVPDNPAVCAIDVRGGGPGTRESDALGLETLVDRVDAIVLSGGSVYGLAAGDGVCTALGAQGKGFALMKGRSGAPPPPPCPVVPTAILYDLANGGNKAWGEVPPYARLGKEAVNALSRETLLGPIGAGIGARAGLARGGLGSASFFTEEGYGIGAVAAVNSFGSAYVPGTNQFWAAPYELKGEFGGRGMRIRGVQDLPPDTKFGAAAASSSSEAAQKTAHPQGDGAQATRGNTTICAVATNLALSPAETQRLAIMAQDGLARALRPAHAPTDGDIVFALSTARQDIPISVPLLTRLGSIAADVLARAIARGVHAAEGV